MVDGGGQIIDNLRRSSTANPDVGSKTIELGTIPLETLQRAKSLRLLARPYQWVEFRNVQLQPVPHRAGPAPARQPETNPQIVAVMRGLHMEKAVSGRVLAAPGAAAHVRLPNGASVRILGVKDTQAGPDGWWKPDGSGPAKGVAASTLRYPSLPTGAIGRAFAVEATYAPLAQPVARQLGVPAWGSRYLRDSRTAGLFRVKAEARHRIEPDTHAVAVTRPGW